MTKTFTDYLTESKKTFSFKLWFANTDFDDVQLEKLETCLQKYKLEDIAKPKTVPTQEHQFFPGYGAVELTTIEVDLAYPCNATQVHDAIVRSGMNLAGRNLVVLNKGQEENEVADSYPPKEALLNSEYPANNDNGEHYGEKHISNFLKSLKKTGDK